ncbi:MAG: oligosaccharide flippase family protein, partial [Clostridia bacterium]|nr:oligosaccharide flippase family protein [Clostridia bacterium]
MWVVKTFRRSPFLQNAAVLTVTSLVLRAVGIFFRMYLAGRIGAEGMGLYQLVISVYVLASAFAAAGICTAVTRQVTDALCRGDRATALKALRCAVGVSVEVGVVSAGVLYLAADPVSRWFLKDVRAINALRILTVSLPFMGVSSCLKGYFMARRRVSFTARAQLLEQAVRIAVIALLLERVGPTDLSAACAVVMLGDVVAEIASCLHLALGFGRDRRKLPESVAPPAAGVMTAMMGIALPISATRYLTTALHTVENLLVPARISRYTGSRAVALAQFGSLKGMTMPLLFFPASFLSSLSTLLIPELSESAALGRQERVKAAVGRTLQLTLCASILIGGVFYLYAAELGQLLFQHDEVSLMLRVLAPLVPAMYLESLVDGMLKGLGQQVSTLRYNLWDSALRLVLVITVVPRTGMAGFLFVMTVSNLLVAFLNLHRLLTVTEMRLNWRQWVLAPLAAVGLSAVGAEYLP